MAIDDTAAPPVPPPDPTAQEGRLAWACCDRWADGSGRLALLHPGADGALERIGFDALRASSLRVAQALAAHGIGRGARVAILLPQGPEALVALLAADRLDAIAVPLGHALHGTALGRHLRGSGAGALVTDAAGLALLAPLRHAAPALRHVFCTDGARPGAFGFWAEAERAPAPLPAAAPAAARAPALLLYAPDATGRHRGALHARRSILARMAGFVALFGEATDAPVWTALPWAGCGGLLDVVLPALALGRPVLAHEMPRIAPAPFIEAIARLGIGGALLPPGALHALRAAGAVPRPAPALRRIATLGGVLPPALAGWAARTLGVPVLDSLLHPACGVVLVATPGPDGMIGRAPAGRRVAVIDAAGRPLPPGVLGRIALRRPDPGLCLGQGRARTGAGRRGHWLPTGEMGAAQAEGGIVLLPPPGGEARLAAVEACLRAHPAVAAAALLRPVAPQAGASDAGARITAIVVPRRDALPGAALAAELRGFLRAHVPGPPCPPRIGFARDLPGRTSGLPLDAMLEATRGLGPGPGRQPAR